MEILTEIFPKPLTKAASIGLICPAGGLDDLSVVQRTEKYLREAGYGVVLSEMLSSSMGTLKNPELNFLSGTDTQRANDLMKLLKAPDVDAIWCIRGGYGAGLMLDELDFESLKKDKIAKPIIGFSDATAILLALYSKLGLVTIHGPMPKLWFGEKEEMTPDEQTSSQKLWEILRSKEKNFSYSHRTTVIQAGQASGKLLGGNLTTMNYMPPRFLPDFSNSVLFLEDVNEKPYDIHRELFKMGESGILNKVKGIMFCDFDFKTEEEHKEMKAVIEDILKRFGISKNIPVVYGFPIGHGELNLAVPVGRHVTLNVDKNSNTAGLFSS